MIDSKGITVLITDDDVTVRNFLEEVLSQQGYSVLDATDVNDALQIAELFEGEIHVLVTDIIMPVLTGDQLYLKLRELRPNLKVLYISGFPNDINKEHVVIDDGIQFLLKPFTGPVLTERVKMILNR